jgi:hypothetical protein
MPEFEDSQQDEGASLREDAPGFHSVAELDDFILREVVPVYDAMKADPSSALTFEEMQEALVGWNREDGLTDDGDEVPLRRSA